MSRVTLIAVCSARDAVLLPAFVAHYRSQGVGTFLIGLHASEAVAARRAFRHFRRAGIEPALVLNGPWHETMNASTRDALRVRSETRWCALADVDEFHTYPSPIKSLIDRADAARTPIIQGLLLDRVTSDGRLPRIADTTDLDAAFPLGAYLTLRLAGGDPRKVVLAARGSEVALGNHHSTQAHYRDLLVPVHHFKWRAGLVRMLRERRARFRDGSWQEVTPALRTEAGRILNHLAAHGGKIDVSDLSFAARAVTLRAMDFGAWEGEARTVIRDADLVFRPDPSRVAD